MNAFLCHVFSFHSRMLNDGRKRFFNIIEERATELLIQEQDTGVYWKMITPLSVQRIIDGVKKERRLPNAAGLILSGEMQPHQPVTLMWQVR